MNQPGLLEQFATLHFTSQLPETVRRSLVQIARERSFRVGECLCREGTSTRELFLIASGQVALDMLVPGRGQIRIQTLGPGEVLAWSAVVGNHGATASGIATEETHTIVFPDDALISLCQSNHDVGYLVMRELAKAISRRLVATRLQLLDLFQEQSSS
ncbi:MAG: cyclic nucleotide-binding domain-containing protein [Rhodopirellula sp.]|nr:cyclic nucleotide-binding domain-containing protein [Rhodopirellula sp.]